MTDQPAGQAEANEEERAPDGIEALTEEVLPALIARLRASRLGELEVRRGNWRIRLRRDPGPPQRPAMAGGSGKAVASVEGPGGSVARSPAVGYFSPARGLVVGAPVQIGDLLGSVDVLGIAHEVSAPADGVIARILAEDGQAVEYSQPLADIDPLEAAEAAPDGLEGVDA